MQEMEDAKDKVLMGIERKSMVMKDEEKKLTAYHEAGHAIVAIHSKESDPVHKATIIPRGRALGMVMRLPESDRISMSKIKLKADLAVAMGGRIAEEIIFGPSKVTTGASSDISMATNIARKMVTEWGMSDKLGPLAYGENEQEIFLGHSVTQKKNISEGTAQEIDKEIRKIVDEAYKKARSIIKKNINQLHKLAKGLLHYETLTGDEIKDIIKGKKIKKSNIKNAKKKNTTLSPVPTVEKRKKKIGLSEPQVENN
jgi:cell division protease FtsH